MKISYRHILNSSCISLCSLLMTPVFAKAIHPQESIEIMVEDAADPFSKADGTGYANDLVTAAFAAAGVDVKFNVVPYARCKKMTFDGFAIACMNMSWDQKFSGKIIFSDLPLFSVTPTYYESIQHPLRVKNETELGKGIVIGVVHDYEYPRTVMQTQSRGATFDHARSEQGNLKKLVAGRVNTALVMNNELDPENFPIEDGDIRQQVRVAFHSASTQHSYIGFSALHPKGLWALEKFNQGMKIINTNKEFKKHLKEKWKKSASTK